MKKTINLSIGGLSFQIEEDAYAALENYLAEVKTRFASYQDAAEIVSDMEDRIAEQFSAKSKGNQPIGLPTVEELIAIMGRPDQIGDAGKAEAGPKQEPVPKAPAPAKRLYRNPEDAILAGVCSGIAAYLGTDTVWVRLVFALTIFFGGFGVFLYIILWVIVPSAETDTEKLQMRGSPVNLKNLEQTVKDRVAEIKNKDASAVKQGLAAPFKALGGFFGALGRFFRRLLPVVFKIVGVVITVVAALAMAGLVFLAVSLMTNSGSPYVDFPLKEIASGTIYYTAVVSAFFAAFVPIIFVMLLGTSLVAYRSTFEKMGSIMLLGLWIVAVAVFANMAMKLAPQVENLVKTSPYFQTSSKEYALKDFTALEIGGIDEAIVYPGNSYKVIAEGKQKDLSEAKIYIEHNTLKIEREHVFRFCLFCTQDKVKLAIYTPALSQISGSGASRIATASLLQGKNLKINLSGVANLQADVEFEQVSAELSGAAKAGLSGSAGVLLASVSGASKLEATEAQVKRASLDLSGASQAHLGDLEYLKVQASGASTIYYQSAAAVEEKYSGASRSVRGVKKTEVPAELESVNPPAGSLVYRNQAYKFEVTYPASYKLFEGSKPSSENEFYIPMQTYFSKPQSGEIVAAVYLPKNSYPANTDFAGGFFGVAVAQGLTQSECLKFDSDSIARSSGNKIINGAVYAGGEASGAAMSHQSFDKIYHTYKNSQCYEVQIGVRTSGFGAADAVTERVNVDEVFAKLESVLSTFIFSK